MNYFIESYFIHMPFLFQGSLVFIKHLNVSPTVWCSSLTWINLLCLLVCETALVLSFSFCVFHASLSPLLFLFYLLEIV